MAAVTDRQRSAFGIAARSAGPRTGPHSSLPNGTSGEKTVRSGYVGNVARPVQSIERAAAILQLLAASPDRLSLGDVAASLDLAKPTTHGLLRTLVDVGFVDQDRSSGRYELGPGLLRLGGSYLDGNELRARALNWADALASRTNESVRIGTLYGGAVLVVHHGFRPDDSLQTLEIGALLPAHATALGKVLLAYSPGVARDLPAVERFTRRTLSNRRALSRELGEVRRAGWGAEVEEMILGRAGIAAPIRGQGGLVVGAIGISGPRDRLCDARGVARPRLVESVCETAAAVSRELVTGRR